MKKLNKFESRFAIRDNVWFSTPRSNKEGVIVAVLFTEFEVIYKVECKNKVYTVGSFDVRKPE